MKIKTGDSVIVLQGNNAGEIGKVENITEYPGEKMYLVRLADKSLVKLKESWVAYKKDLISPDCISLTRSQFVEAVNRVANPNYFKDKTQVDELILMLSLSATLIGQELEKELFGGDNA